MSTITDVKNAVRIINKYHNKVSILHCVSNYPTKIFDSDLSRIQYLKKKFPKNKIGLSDHTNGISSSIFNNSSSGVIFLPLSFNLKEIPFLSSKPNGSFEKVAKDDVVTYTLFMDSINIPLIRCHFSFLFQHFLNL